MWKILFVVRYQTLQSILLFTNIWIIYYTCIDLDTLENFDSPRDVAVILMIILKDTDILRRHRMDYGFYRRVGTSAKRIQSVTVFTSNV